MRIALPNCHPHIREAEFKRLLRVPANFAYEGPMAELRAWVENWYRREGRPWLYVRSVKQVEIRERSVFIDGNEFRSAELRKRFHRARATSAVAVAISAGAEAEIEALRKWQSDLPDHYYFLEVYASAVVEALLTEAGGRICAWADAAGWSVLPHYSPGYQGWNLQDQASIFSLLSGAGERLPGELEVLDSGMLRPKKSLVAIFGLSEDVDRVERFGQDLVPCRSCAHVRCEYRREPYRLTASAAGRRGSEES